MSTRKSSRAGQRKIDVSAEVEALHRETDVDAVKSKKDPQLFFEDRGRVATKSRWKSHVLRADLILGEAASAKEIIPAGKVFRAYNPSHVLPKKKKGVKRKVKLDTVGKYDLWDAERRAADIAQPVKDTTGGWLAPVQPRAPKAPKRRKTSEIPAVETPTPGESFRPTPEAHRDEIAAAVEDARREVRKVERIERATKRISKRKIVGRQRADLEHALELVDEAEGGADDGEIPDLKVDTGSDGDEGEGEGESESKAVEMALLAGKRKPKKTVARARKERAAGKKEQLGRIEEIAAQVDEEMKTREQKVALRKIARDERMAKTLKLGPVAFVPDPKPVFVPSELPSKLREMPNVSSLVRERFLSFQKRNIVAPKKMRVRTGITKRIKFRETSVARGIRSASDPATYIATL